MATKEQSIAELMGSNLHHLTMMTEAKPGDRAMTITATRKAYQPLNDFDLSYFMDHYNQLHDSAILAIRTDPEHAHRLWNALDTMRHLLYIASEEGYLKIRWDEDGKGVRLENLTACIR